MPSPRPSLSRSLSFDQVEMTVHKRVLGWEQVMCHTCDASLTGVESDMPTKFFERSTEWLGPLDSCYVKPPTDRRILSSHSFCH